MHQHAEIVDVLMQKGANPTLKNIQVWFCGHQTLRRGKDEDAFSLHGASEAIRALLSRGASAASSKAPLPPSSKQAIQTEKGESGSSQFDYSRKARKKMMLNRECLYVSSFDVCTDCISWR